MMPAAKMMDPVMGIDVHIIQPPGPVPPLPVPHPFVGMLFDPMELAPFVGASVFVNGMPKATAGSEGKAVPPHIPIGGVFVPPPPGNECEMFMGSATVLFEGEPASYTALPALSCQTVGMPAPFRLKKKPKPILKLPTSVVVPIPAGPPVLIGGPPTISLTVIGMKILMSAAGKAAKKLRKMLKKSKKAKAISKRIHKKAAKAMDKLGVPDNIRNKVHKAICTVTGHPVDVVAGKVFTEAVDFRLPGPIPFAWERTWYSTSTYRGPLGHGWHHGWDLALAEEGSAAAVRMADGRPVAFPRLAPGQSHFDRAERLTLTRDQDGYVLLDMQGLRHRFSARPTAKGEHPLASVSNAAGHRIHFDRDDQGRLLGILDSAGRTLRVALDRLDRITAIVLADPADPARGLPLMRYRYDERGDLSDATDPLGASWRFEYRNHLLVREVNRNGLAFHFHYDGEDHRARCVRTWGDKGIYDHRLAYDLAGRRTTVTNSLGHATLHLWTEQGVVTRTVDPLGRVTETFYNEFNQVEKSVDPLGQATGFAYDDRGHCVEVKKPDGTVLTAAYRDDRPVLLVDETGAEWKWEYDADGNPLRSVNPLGQASEYAFDKGLLSLYRSPDGAETAFAYDRSGNLATVRLPNGAESGWTYDSLGRAIAVVDPRGKVQRRHYDAAGRLVKVERPDGDVTEMAYDGEDNMLSSRSARTQVAFEYGGSNRLTARIENGARVEYHYDTEENLVGIRNEHGFAFRFALNAAGEVVEESGFDGVARKYDYDGKGRPVRVERSGGFVSEFAYDAMDRMVAIKHGDGTAEAYAFREDGMLMSAENADAKVAFERDALGRVTREIQGSHWVGSRWDAGGRRSLVESSFGLRHSVARDAMGWAEKASLEDAGGSPLWSASFKRDMMGLELERSLPGGLKSVWKRDDFGRPVQHNLWSPKFTRRREYGWSLGDRLREIRDSLWGATQFAHDPVENLLWALDQDGSIEMRMPDAVGNLFRNEDRSDRTYGPAGQLLEARGPKGATRYEYDGLGNLVRKILPDGRAWSYSWNGAGYLAKVVRPDGDEVEFAYDALGRRVRKAFRGATTRWVWDGNVPLHEWVEKKPVAAAPQAPPPAGADAARAKALDALLAGRPASGPPPAPEPIPTLAPDEAGTADSPVTWLFEPESHRPMARVAGGNALSILTDHLGSPFALAGADGKLAWSAKIGAYGTVDELSGNAALCPFRFPGQYEDLETGLFYNRYRYYDPDSGIYISQDPIGLLGGLRPYAYTKNPPQWTDVFGLDCSKDAAKLRKNMTDKGMKELDVPDAAHHMVMSNSKDPRMKKLRKKFDDLGIDINSHKNGVFLPKNKDAVGDTGLTPHSTIHTDSYKQEVYDRLKDKTTKRQVENELARIREDILSGALK